MDYLSFEGSKMLDRVRYTIPSFIQENFILLLFFFKICQTKKVYCKICNNFMTKFAKAFIKILFLNMNF